MGPIIRAVNNISEPTICPENAQDVSFLHLDKADALSGQCSVDSSEC